MEQKQKRPRVKRVKKYKVLYPEYFGLDPDQPFVFDKTVGGYCCRINSGAYIGMPRYLIEGHPHLFKLL